MRRSLFEEPAIRAFAELPCRFIVEVDGARYSRFTAFLRDNAAPIIAIDELTEAEARICGLFLENIPTSKEGH